MFLCNCAVAFFSSSTFFADMNNSWDISLLLLLFFCFPFKAKSCNRCGVWSRYTHSCESSWHVSQFKAFPRVLSVFYLFISLQWHEPQTLWCFPLKSPKVLPLIFLLNTTKKYPIPPYLFSLKPYCRTDAQC